MKEKPAPQYWIYSLVNWGKKKFEICPKSHNNKLPTWLKKKKNYLGYAGIHRLTNQSSFPHLYLT